MSQSMIPISEFHPRFNLFSLPFRINDGITFPLSASNTGSTWVSGRPDGANNIYAQKVCLTCIVPTTFDTTNKWQVQLNKQDNNATNATVGSNQDLWIAGRSPGKRFTHEIAVNTFYDLTTLQTFYVGFTKVAAPGNLSVDSIILWYNFV